jgi:hypothetical protein
VYVRADQADRIDNQIDVLGKAFLGLTVACARCHDHKFDAISTRDYYALAGYLRSSRYQEASIDPPGPMDEAIHRLKVLHNQARATAMATTARWLDEGMGDWLLGISSSSRPPRDILCPLTDLTTTSASRPSKLSSPPKRGESGEDAAGSNGANAILFAARRRALVESLKKQTARATTDAKRFTTFADFHSGSFRDWFVTGQAFDDGPSRAGDLVWQPGRWPPVRAILPAGVAHSGLASDQLQGVLRSRTFTIGHKKIWYHAAGHGGQINLIIDGYQRIRDPIYGGLTIKVEGGDRLAWHGQDVGMWLGHRAYIELIDHGPGVVALDRILFSDHDSRPTEAPNQLLLRLLDNPKICSAEALTARLRDLFREILDQWQAGRLGSAADSADRVGLLNDLLREASTRASLAGGAFPQLGMESSSLGALLDQIRQVEATLATPRRVMAMADGTGENEHVFIRGSPKNLGPEVPRRFLEALAGPDQPTSEAGSGRLILARRMVHSSDALLPRVLVNRLWQHHFGEGIVRTPDNFGVHGQPPTHPELLDYLSSELVASGWSIKHLHRLMVLSSAYQMASRHDAADATDPDNRLLHRMTIRRLEAEAIRDAILAVSGGLVQRLYGPSVPPHLTPFMVGRGRPAVSGPVDGAGRRSIYLGVRRNFLSPLFLAFDYPIPFTTMGRRSVSHVPAQALTLMNNRFVVQQAGVWARHALAADGLAPAERVRRMHVAAFGRPPTAGELADALAFLRAQGGPAWPGDPRTWADLAHVFFNVKAFVFID